MSDEVYQASPAVCVREARQHLWNAEQSLRDGDVDAAAESLRSVRSWLHGGLEQEWDDRMAEWMNRVGPPTT